MILKIIWYDKQSGVQDAVYGHVVDYFVSRGAYGDIKAKGDRHLVNDWEVRDHTQAVRIHVKRVFPGCSENMNFELVTDSSDIYVLNDSGETIDRIKR